MVLHEITKEEILVNKMYVGSYLENEHNIGHEVINLLRADDKVDSNGDGQNYIYVQPYGTMENEHNNKIDTIVLVRNTGIPEALEVLGQAWDLEQIAKIEKTSRKKEIDRIAEHQFEYIKNNNITYNGILLNEIYYGNLFQKEVCISFKANKLRKPKKPIYLYFGSNNNHNLKILEDKGVVIKLNSHDINTDENSDTVVAQTVDMAKASLKMYFRNGKVKATKNKHFPSRKFIDQTSAFQVLKTMLEDVSFWEDKNTTQNAADIKCFYKYDRSNFIDILDKQNVEVTYSNLFKYIFESNTELFRTFTKEVLGIENMTDKYLVERETAHIDLLISDTNNVIVIENKIKSGINGIKYDIYGEEVGSQLLDYYKYIFGFKKKKSGNKLEWIKDEGLINKFKNKEKHFFIFAPDYNKIDTKKINSIPSTYKIIPYSKIFEFYDKYHDILSYRYPNNIPYYHEFIYAIEKHCNSIDNVLEIETHKRFLKRIY